MQLKPNIQICTRCVYDSKIPSISFDDNGVCNYCAMHDSLEKEYPIGKAGKKKLEALVQQIKLEGKGKPYDCVVGVSGGCDSSYLLYKVKKLGLRPIAAHFDNTWNSTISTINLARMLKKLNVDLFTIVVDNKEYDDIYRSFLKAGVADIEAPTDIALAATLYKAAEKFNVRYIIEGHSFRTEGISPLGWLYMDGKYIHSVHRQYGVLPMHTYPNLWMSQFLKWMIVKRIKKVRPLYFMDYDKEAAKKLLRDKFNWQWYGGHHLENRYTAFYHGYYLPQRFNIDTRPLGFAALVRSGQMSRKKALEILKSPPICDPEILALVKKRLGFSEKEFTQVMHAPKRNYKDFKTYKETFESMRPFFWLMYKLDLVPKSFYLKYTVKHEFETSKQ